MLRFQQIAALALSTVLAGQATPASAQTNAAEASGMAKAQEASAALVKGSATAAVTLFTEALKDVTLSSDRRAALLNDRAVAYGRLGQPRLAIDDFNKAAQLFPEYAALYNNRGNTLLALGQPREAIKDFDRAILLTPGSAASARSPW
jgi:Tfp pilus assembly protein PilF